MSLRHLQDRKRKSGFSLGEMESPGLQNMGGNGKCGIDETSERERGTMKREESAAKS